MWWPLQTTLLVTDLSPILGKSSDVSRYTVPFLLVPTCWTDRVGKEEAWAGSNQKYLPRSD